MKAGPEFLPGPFRNEQNRRRSRRLVPEASDIVS